MDYYLCIFITYDDYHDYIFNPALLPRQDSIHDFPSHFILMNNPVRSVRLRNSDQSEVTH